MKLHRSLLLTSVLLSLVWAGCNDESGNSKEDNTCTGENCGNNTECPGENCDTDVQQDKTCTDGKELCKSDNECYDLTTDKEHCGSCDNKCLGDKKCIGGICKFDCGADETECSDGCHNLNNDSKNCETCGHDCNADRSEDEPQMLCVEKACVLQCPNDQVVCDGNCVNPMTSKQFCGAENGCSEEKAGVSCGDGFKCETGTCVCEDAELSECLGTDGKVCTNPLNDTNYCGCTADSAGLKCDGLDHVASGTCESGKCQIACAEHFDNCNEDVADGCETDLNTVEHCGSCDKACDTSNSKSASCESGSCKLVCADDAQMCGDLCKNLSNDKDNCGWCGHVCGSDLVCSNGLCTTPEDKVCDGGFMDVTIGKRTVHAYCIDSYEKLVQVRDAINRGNKYPDNTNVDNAYILMKDIAIKSDGTWVAIGRYDTSGFAGVFLGNGKTISGLSFGCDTYMGLFGYVYSHSMIDGLALEIDTASDTVCSYSGVLGGHIQDSSVSNVVVNGTFACTGFTCGGLFGEAQNSSFTNIKTDLVMKAASTSGASPHGGLIGDAQQVSISAVNAKIQMINKSNPNVRGGLIGRIKEGETSYISNITISGKLDYDETVPTSSRFGQTIGGLIGGGSGDTIISHCDVDVDLLLPGNANGGLIGGAANVKISDTVVKGKTRCSWGCGGFIGTLSNAEISGSKVLGDIESISVNGTDWRNGVGGFVGSMTGNVVIRDSVVDGTVNSVFSGTGGFVGVGVGGTIEHCQANGDVNGPASVGGFIGTSQTVIKNSVSRGNVTGMGDVGGFVGYAKNTQNAGTYYVSNISNSAAFGNVNCNYESCNAGGFAADSYMTIMTDCAAFGDVTGVNIDNGTGGGFIGVSSADKLDNIYSTGNVSKFAKLGKFAGTYQGSMGSSEGEFNHGYYWKGSTSIGSISGEGDIDTTKISEFDYTSNVPMVSTDKKLLESLGENWVEVKCELKTGPGRDATGEYTVPLPKGVEDIACL